MVRIKIIYIFSTMAAFMSAGTPEARAKVFQSNGQQVLVELFTSEGCSSCPRADDWLVELGKDQGLYKTFAPVAFHVDYWNHIGWKDPFSHKTYSSRQKRYVRLGNLDYVATPTIVVQGKRHADWHKGVSLPSFTGQPAAIKVIYKSARVFFIDYRPKGSTQAHLANICLLTRRVENKVTAGENQSKTLQHDFATLGCASKKLNKLKESYRATIKVPMHSTFKPSEYAFTLWFSTPTSQTPLHAMGGILGKEL